MKSIRMRIEEDDCGLQLVSECPVPMHKAALYFCKDHRLWLCDKERVISLLEKYGEDGEFCIIGKTEYIMIFPKECMVQLDGERYIIGECLIMKCHKGPECLTEEEINEAFNEYASRVRKLFVGQEIIYGYQMD